MSKQLVMIEPHSLTAPVVRSVEIEIMELVLDSHVVVLVKYKGGNGNLLENHIVRIEGDEYNAWGDDDNYITNLVLTKLGLTELNLDGSIQSTEEPVTEEPATEEPVTEEPATEETKTE